MKSYWVISALMGIALLCLPEAATAMDLERVGGKLDTLAPASGGQIWVQVYPWSRTPGKQETSSVEAAFPQGAKDIVFYASLGRITDVEMLSPSRAKAKYHAPKSYLPQIDIVTAMATVDGERIWGFATVLLVGQGEAEIKTRPGVEAYITIGERVFGPEIADRKGNAKIEVEVLPGIQFGQDEQGNAVDLKVPVTARTAVFAATTKVPVDKVDEVDLFAVVAAQDGFLDEMSPIVVIAEKGDVVDLKSIGHGAFTARFLAPVGYRGKVIIQAFVPGDEAPPAEVTLELGDSFNFANFEMQGKGRTKVGYGDLEYNAYATAKLGFAWDFTSMAALCIGADTGASLKLFEETFAAGLEFGFMLSSKTSPVYINDISDNEIRLEAEATTLIFPIAASLGWFRQLSDGFGLWILAEGGFVFVKSKINTTSDAEGVEGVETVDVQIAQRRLENLGLVGLGSAFEWAAGPGYVVTGFRWRFYPGEIKSIHGVFSSINLNVGYRFWFF